MNNYIKLIKNKLQLTNNKKAKLFSGVMALLVAVVLLGTAYTSSLGGNPFDPSAYADTFSTTRDVKNCDMHTSTGYSYSGTATPGMVYNPADLQGGVAPTKSTDLYYLNSRGWLRRGDTYGTVSVAPGMSVDLTNFVSNKTDNQDAGTSNTRIRLGDAVNLMQPGSANAKVEKLSVDYIAYGKTKTTTDNFISLGEGKRDSKPGDTFKNGTASFKAIQPITLIGERKVSTEYKDGKTFITSTIVLKNNTVYNLSEQEVVVDTRVNGQVVSKGVAFEPNQEVTVNQVFDLGNSENASTQIESSIVNVKKKFTATIAKKANGDFNNLATESMTEYNTGFVTRHAGNVTGNQIGSYPTKIDFTLSIIPHSFSTNSNIVPRPTPKKVDLKLTKTTLTPIVKAGGQAEFKLTVENVGQDKVNGFRIDDLMPDTFDMSTLQTEFDANKAKQVFRESNANIYTGKFEFLDGGLLPGKSFELILKIKAKVDTNCKEAVTNFARISTEGYTSRQEENYLPSYDLKNGCKVNDNNCSSSIVKFDCYIPTVGLGLSKTIKDQKLSYKSGEEVVYNFKVVNNGEEDVKGFSFIDVLPEGSDLASVSNIQNANQDVKVDGYKVEGKNVKANFNFTNGFKKGSVYEFSLSVKIGKDVECKGMMNIARVSLVGLTLNGKVETGPQTDITRETCKQGDNNCSAVTLQVACVEPTIDLSLVKTVADSNGQKTFKEGETIVYNLAVKKTGKQTPDTIRITDTIPAELDASSYVATVPAGYTIDSMKKAQNLDGTTMITFLVRSIMADGQTLNIRTAVIVKTGASCKPIVNVARVDLVNGNKTETPATNQSNGFCLVYANENGKQNSKNCVNSCVFSYQDYVAGKTAADANCVLKACVTGDNNCSTASTNLYCEPTPMLAVPKKETPRTGAGVTSIALGLSSLMFMLIAFTLIKSSSNRKVKLDL
jgi:uncharacterized repeat protein (TIGR01451 family)